MSEYRTICYIALVQWHALVVVQQLISIWSGRSHFPYNENME